jgi:cephalosporin hydroxylase
MPQSASKSETPDTLSAKVPTDSEKVATLRARVKEKDGVIAELRARLQKKNEQIAHLNNAIGWEKVEPKISEAYHRLYYHSRGFLPNTHLGYQILQCPLDLQIYQELIFRLRPASIVQTGVFNGGSALYLASVLDLMQMDPSCLVIAIDLKLTDRAKTLSHPRIRLIEGSSTAPETVRQVEALLPSGGAFVSLDSDHSQKHVADEIRIYREYVPVGSYLVVEDTNINSHPVFPEHGPGPFEAVEDFLKEDARFERDNEIWKRHFFSFHTWIKRLR